MCKTKSDIQIDFGVQFLMKRVMKCTFWQQLIVSINTAYIYDKANGSNVLKFLDMYIEIHGIPRSIRLIQAKCLVGNQVKTLCNKNNINIIEAPVNDHRAIGLVERLTQTIKNRLACIKEEKLPNATFM